MVGDDKPGRRGPNRRAFLKAAGASSLLGVSGLAGCTGRMGGGGGGSVLVGGVVPLSGPLAQLGESEQKGIEVAVDHINEELDGMAGREVEAIFEDTATDPETGREKARKLVEQDDVDLLAGAVSGAVAASIAEYAYGPRVPFWTYGGAAATTGADCKPTTFRYTTHTTQDARAGAPWALENLGPNVWIHYAEYAYGQAIRSDWERVITESSMDANVVDVTSTPIGTSEYSSYISQVQASDADWLLMAVTGSDLISMVQQADQFGLKEEKALVSQNVTTIPIRQAIGSAGVGVYGNIRYSLDFDSPENEALKQAYRAAHDEPPTDPAMVLWTSLLLHARAANAAGSVATGDVVPELEGLESGTPMGRTTVRACDHQAVRDVPMGRITEPRDFDWPDLETMATRPGDEVIPSCSETGCDMPSL